MRGLVDVGKLEPRLAIASRKPIARLASPSHVGPQTPQHPTRVGCCHLSLCHRMYLLIGFRKSTPPQNRQLYILIGRSRQYADLSEGALVRGLVDVGELEPRLAIGRDHRSKQPHIEACPQRLKSTPTESQPPQLNKPPSEGTLK